LFDKYIYLKFSTPTNNIINVEVAKVLGY